MSGGVEPAEIAKRFSENMEWEIAGDTGVLAWIGQQVLHTFQHIIVVFRENRTPDNLFGSSPTFETGVGFQTPASGHWCLGACFDSNHSHQAWENMWNTDAYGLPITTHGTTQQRRYLEACD